MLNEVKILKGQTLADIAIQETGWLEGLFDIAETNDISITEEVAAGTGVSIDNELVDSNQLRLNKLSLLEPATLFGPWVANEETAPALGGIGYMAVGIDFIVS